MKQPWLTQRNAGGTKRPILLVGEDDEGVRKLLNLVLEEHGFSVLLAATGQEAVHLYRQHKDSIDLVLLDVQMPKMDGPHALVELKKINPAVRCCFMTASSGPYSTEDLLRLGAERVISKPFASLGELVELLHEIAASPT